MLYDVAIVGGGVSGLSAAYELQKRNRSVVVLERESRSGGVVQTERIGAFVIDAGPDALLAQKPAAVMLCQELGIGDRLFPTKVPRTAFVLRHGRLHPLPAASVLGFPTRIKPFATSSLFSLKGKIRMGAELFIPRRRHGGDESIASFVGRRFGREAVSYIAEPLLAGIHAGDVERLSMRALFPRLLDAEAASGSVIRAFRRSHRAPDADGAFRSFPNGLAELTDALTKTLGSDGVRYRAHVTRIQEENGFTLHLDGEPPIRARAIVLAVPAFVASPLLRPLDDPMAAECEAIRYLSTATVAAAFHREDVRHDLQGTGFVVPRSEGISITAGAWISSKWPQRAPEGYALLRAFLGGARDPDVLSRTDEELTRAALGDLSTILDIRGTPMFTRVYRWNRSSPQQEVGHAERMARIDAGLARHPGLFVSAAGFRGVGIPDCVADARATAAAADTFLKTIAPEPSGSAGL
jgi:protoporphyrinogen/coproporphyrinogen III oxidase